MIRVIAHRANLEGPSPDENSPSLIDKSLSMGFDVEVDVWVKDNMLFLGHDQPEYQIDFNFLTQRKDNLWVHCKNVEALEKLLQVQGINVFWHQHDDYTLTRSNHIWTYPGRDITKSSVSVMPNDTQKEILLDPFAICTDYPINTLKILQLQKVK
jgi:glycerophosphoryl diester phosphodiesterase